MKTKTSYTIIIEKDGKRTEVYGNYQECKEKVYAELSKYDDNEKVSFLWYYQKYNWNERFQNFIGDGNIVNISSHCIYDGSNWLTVREIKNQIGNLKIDGTMKELFTPSKEKAVENNLDEELLDD